MMNMELVFQKDGSSKSFNGLIIDQNNKMHQKKLHL